ncbi:MAG: cell surface protein SprA [Candidatus Zixiibacteriota bacterium]
MRFRAVVAFSILIFSAMLGALSPEVRAAGIGFQAALDTQDSVVSRFNEIPYQFSAALYPRTHAVLSQTLSYNPQLRRSDFETHTLVFNTDYQKGKSLIPVAVDADQFLAFRVDRAQNQGMLDAIRKNRFDSKKQSQRAGINIGVALPKRLDRVFGEGGGNLKVSGYRRITFAGRSQWTDGASSDLIRPSKFPALNMQQVYQFSIEGTIGTKISVRVSEDSQTDIPLANRLMIRYKGDEDDVLKAVEAGNTTLDLPNTRFVGYSSRIQGLFGFKAAAQVGHLKVTGIMSQEKGSSERASITGSGEQTAQYIRDYQFAEGRIFDLAYPGEMGPNDSIIEVVVYEEVIQLNSPSDGWAKFSIDPNNPSRDSAFAESVKVNLVPYTEYTTRSDTARLHYIVFNSARSPNRTLGIYMRYYSADSQKVIQVGVNALTDSTALRLKMLRSGHASYSPFHPTWNLQWRNVYLVPKVTSVEDLGIKVFKGKSGLEGTTSSLDYQELSGQSQGYYLRILGLDQYAGQIKSPDNKMDDRREVYEPDWGLIIFPNRRPFDSDTTYGTGTALESVPLALRVPKIYDYFSSNERAGASEYYIQITARARSSIVRLNRANIIEGSERVTLNGRLLARDVGYRIDYNFGQVTLLDQLAIDDPNANLNIEFEYAPFLALQKKTLLGMRLEYEWSQDLRFGSTILYKSDKAQERKPRVGQETAQMMVLDFDGRFRVNTSFMTKVADALPLVSTDAPSSLSISGEVAQSRPNPNINGVAYVDDFESAVDQLSLGMLRLAWSASSRPVQLTPDYVPAFQPDSTKKVKLLWHNPLGGIRVDSVYSRESKQGEGTINFLRFILRPDTTGLRSWGGVMANFGSRVDADRVQLFEVRLRGDRGRLHFDFGQINEDVNGNGLVDGTEDPDGNGSVDDGQDLGLDGLPDAAEPGYDAATNPDPSNDDWYFQGDGQCPVPPSRCGNPAFQDSLKNSNSPIFYDWLNGTEGNSRDVAVLSRPDQEKLSSSANTINNYFSYKVDLSEDSFLVRGSELNGWRTYRIPILEQSVLDTVVGSNPQWANITHVRVWLETPPRFSSDTMYDTVDVAAWYFVQSSWRDSLLLGVPAADTLTRGASRFYVASVSTEDRTFTPPPGVSAYTDPSTNVEEPQRGLALVYTKLYPKDTCLAYKKLIQTDKYTGYSRIKMYVHGDVDNVADSLFFFYRLGRDSLNFYEYRTYIRPGWDAANEVDIKFNDITALKDAAQRGKTTVNAPVDTTAGHYRVKGRPSLNEVAYFTAGLINESAQPIEGQVWLDEMRVTDVRRDVGTAGRIELQGNMGDLLTYSFQFDSRDPFFRGVSAATRGGSNDNLGSGNSDKNYSYSVSLNFDKFLPRSWNARIPIGYSSSKSTKLPLLRTASDIVLAPEVRKLEKTESESRSVNVSESFSLKGRNPLFALLLNRQTAGFSYSRSVNRTPQSPYSFGESYNIRADYNMGWTKPPTLPIFFWTKPIPFLKKTAKSRLGLYPYQWQWSGTFNRTLSLNDDINARRTSSRTRTLDGRMNLAYKMFDNLSANYSFTTRRDLTNPDDVRLKVGGLRLGLELSYSQSFSSNYAPAILPFLGTAFTFGSTYNDTYDRGTTARKSDLSNNWGIGGSFKHQVLFNTGTKTGGGGGAGGGRTTPQTTEPKKGSGRPFYDPPLALLRFLTHWIEPISYKYSRTFSNSLPGMVTRPGLAYRLGFDRRPNVATIRDSRPPSSSQGESYEFGTGFTFVGGISTDLRFRRSSSRDLVTQGPKYRRTTTSWPDLTIRIGRFTNPPILKDVLNKLIQVFSPQTGYNRSIKEEYNLTGGYYTARNVSQDYSPLLSVNFKVFKSLSLSASYSVRKSDDKRFSSANGSLQAETKTTNKNLSMSTGYRFSAPSGINIPLFGKMKFTSTMQIDLRMQKSDNRSENSTAGGPFTINSNSSDFSISPQISYNFSQQLKGGLSATWQDRNDRYAKRKSHVRELQIFAEIRF